MPLLPSPPDPPLSVHACIRAVANRGTVSCGSNRTRYAKYTREYLMSRPEGGGGGGGHVPLVPPPRSAPDLAWGKEERSWPRSWGKEERSWPRS